jgi:hypothetical protein
VNAPARFRGLLLALASWLAAACNPGAGSVIELETPAAAGSGQVHLSRDVDGRPVMSWLEVRGDLATLEYSQLADGAWSAPVRVASGTNWFVNWADFPSVTPVSDRLWAAHWLVRRPAGTYAYDVAIATSADGGQTWDAVLTPHHDGTATEHGFVTLLPWEGRPAAIWLDGRSTVADGAAHGADGAMSLRFASVDGADTRDDSVLDERVCDCCQTDAAVTSRGAVVVYRDRTEAEVRDVYVGRLEDATWHPGVPVAEDGWTVAGCPVNGPAVDAAGEQVVVVWYTEAEDRASVRTAFSIDGGATFSAAVDVSDASPLGRVDVSLLRDGSAVVSWMEKTDRDGAVLMLRRLSPTGLASPPLRAVRIGARRPSGFPQLLAFDESLLIAWTDTSGDDSRVRTALVPADTLTLR